jgi:hypothetical protein
MRNRLDVAVALGELGAGTVGAIDVLRIEVASLVKRGYNIQWP